LGMTARTLFFVGGTQAVYPHDFNELAYAQ
jgi:hypothetical protein